MGYGADTVIHAYRFATVTALHDGLARKLLYGTRDELDDANSVDVQLHNVVAGAKRFEWDYLVNRLWVPRTRWTTMVRQYVDPASLHSWLEMIEDRFPQSKRGIAVLRTNTVQARQAGRGVTRRWGSCMLSLSVRVKPQPQITLHSRTCYLGYLSVLDLTVAHVCARMAAERIGIEVEDFSFVWQLEMAQFHGFRCLAWPLGDPDLYAEFCNHDWSKARYPGTFIARQWLHRLSKLDEDGVPYGDMPFSSYKRVRRRWHAEAMPDGYGDQFAGGKKNDKPYKRLPDVHVSELDFSPLNLGWL